MSARRKIDPSEAGYEVGYGKPPTHSRFQKGRSGNPGGRPRGRTHGRLKEIALEEAYRPLTVRDGDNVIRVPALQALMRAKIALAVKGNGPAQRALIDLVRALESELPPTPEPPPRPEPPEVSDMTKIEMARRIAFALQLGARAIEKRKEEGRPVSPEDEALLLAIRA